MFGKPVAMVAKPFGKPGEIDGIGQRSADITAFMAAGPVNSLWDRPDVGARSDGTKPQQPNLRYRKATTLRFMAVLLKWRLNSRVGCVFRRRVQNSTGLNIGDIQGSKFC